MIVIHARFDVEPAHRAAFVAGCAEAQALTRQEQGCIAYQFSADIDDADAFYLLELWESEEALESHMRTRHLKDFLRLAHRTCTLRSKVFEGPMRKYRIRIPELD